MSGLETAIRNALERADRSNAETRARIYQSARQALEAGLRKQDVNDPETVALQRQRLEVTIRQIEGEERARLHAEAAKAEPAATANGAPAPRATPHPQLHDQVAGAPLDTAQPHEDTYADLGDMRAESADRFGAAPHAASAKGQDIGGLDVPAETVAHRRRRRTFFPRLFIFSTIIAALGIGIWWVYTSGLLLTAAQRDTSVANPPAHVEAEDFDNSSPVGTNGEGGGLRTLDPQNGFSNAWIEVLRPDSADVTPRSNSAVDVVSGGGGQTVRITSRRPDDSGSVEITIPAEALEQMAGKTSTIALTLQTEPDQPTQISVQCDFQSLGDCTRHRFSVTNEKSDVLFQVTFDRSLAPNGPGRLLVNSDIEGRGRSVNLYAVRILPGQ
ncbi:hypothetical protein MRS76_09820 [Rhizobiaceae bacterium n13]|uniref:Biotin transporter BioY n=1 Tax=Ferirhizobium litorale TaxID=2927786 RepID=A0AAE3QCP7_9HYPH|nr:hypothetical protein [Fererhizobium litorale]MDI7862255.1 hypothetical protein [Fererhizobium litorale]MDI7922471.1 hypothetical protein [Fererhizobium litorale]